VQPSSLDTFYNRLATATDAEVPTLLPGGLTPQADHFNVFNLADLVPPGHERPAMPYNRRTYYKISLLSGHHRVEYADKVIQLTQPALLFSTPNIPYHYVPLETEWRGYFCLFTENFLLPATGGMALDELPIFRVGGDPVAQLTDEQHAAGQAIFEKMQRVIASAYAYKYELLRTYTLELIHFGQQLQPAPAQPLPPSAAARVAALFIELLERQFPLETPQQRLRLRSAQDYADRLAIGVNHLNRDYLRDCRQPGLRGSGALFQLF
jgi:AraC family transcriptional activator of pobA